MKALQRFVKGIADELIKLGILLLLNLIFISCPQGLDRVDCFAFDLDGKGNKI